MAADLPPFTKEQLPQARMALRRQRRWLWVVDITTVASLPLMATYGLEPWIIAMVVAYGIGCGLILRSVRRRLIQRVEASSPG